MDVTFHTDPRAFLDQAGKLLAADPLGTSILATTAQRYVATGMPEGPFWFATVSDADRVVGVAMRTHPAPPHVGLVATMPEDAVSALAAALAERGEVVPGWNGDMAAARALAEAGAAATGGRVEVPEYLRLFELREVVWPREPEGTLRGATTDDLDLLEEWTLAFERDAEVQGGRDPEALEHDPTLRGRVAQRIAEGLYAIWEVDGTPVHVTGANPPAFGVVRIGPVYTPEEHRGRGYAGWVVATVSQRALDAGHRPCLYTDQANPVSNKVYERIGYEAVRDEATHLVIS